MKVVLTVQAVAGEAVTVGTTAAPPERRRWLPTLNSQAHFHRRRSGQRKPSVPSQIAPGIQPCCGGCELQWPQTSSWSPQGSHHADLVPQLPQAKSPKFTETGLCPHLPRTPRTWQDISNPAEDTITDARGTLPAYLPGSASSAALPGHQLCMLPLHASCSYEGCVLGHRRAPPAATAAPAL